jgi:hypothetical protein
LTSIPSDDRIKIIEEIKKLKDDSPKDNWSCLPGDRHNINSRGLRGTNTRERV